MWSHKKAALGRVDINTVAQDASPARVAKKAVEPASKDAMYLEPDAQRVRSPPHDKHNRHVTIVEHQGKSGLIFRPPLEYTQADAAAAADSASGAADASSDAVLVAHVFKEAGDWDAGELIVKPMAVKPWRSTGNGTIAMRVLDGSAWLHIEHEPVDDDALDDGVESPRAAALEKSSRLLCRADWVCIPPWSRYQLRGVGLDEAVGGASQPPSFHAAYFARLYADLPAGHARAWDLYEGGGGKPATPMIAKDSAARKLPKLRKAHDDETSEGAPPDDQSRAVRIQRPARDDALN